MAKNKFRITENDFLLANRKASREEEIAKYGRQILLRTSVHKSKKVYDRKRLKKAGIKTDDLPFFSLYPVDIRCVDSKRFSVPVFLLHDFVTFQLPVLMSPAMMNF